MNDDLITGTVGNMGIAYKDILTKRTAINQSDIWEDTNQMRDLRDFIAKQHATQLDLQVLEQLKEVINAPKVKSKEERVVEIVKGKFEDHFGMSLYEFQAIYEDILDNNPEKLV